MKNITNKASFVIASAALVLIVGLSMAALPAQANAAVYQGGYGSQYACAHPYVYPNGYYYCGNQAATVIQAPIYQQQPVYQQPVYQQPVYQALTASCYATNTSVPMGTSVQWTAYVSGGNGTYSYNWSGTDGLYGVGQTSYMTYYTAGYKSATLTVYSAGQSINVACTSSVNVYDNTYNYNNYYNSYPQTYVQPIVQQPVYQQPIVQQGPTYINSNSNGLDIGCFADPTSATVNQPVTWNVEVTGGASPYSYSWSGTDGLTGSSNTVIKYYSTGGAKSAIVTVTSADGRTGVRACSNTVTVTRPGSGTVAPVQQPPVQPPQNQQGNNSLGASAAFSLNNVPWGWVAVLVILVLFGTVMYLLFNRPKI